MKKLYFLFALFAFLALSLSSIKAQSQILFLEAHSQKPIAGVLVYSSQNQVVTDQKGKASLQDFTPDALIKFQHTQFLIPDSLFFNIKKEEKLKLIFLEEKILNLEEVFIAAQAWESDKAEIPFQIRKIGNAEIKLLAPATTPDLLHKTGEVFVQKSQLGGGSPMLRGFAANGLLLVLDGVRLNNAIYRGGNLQNSLMIDVNGLENAELIFGTGAILYGSDALGGVIDFHTQTPQFSEKTYIKAETLLRYASANREKTLHLNLAYGGKKWAATTVFSFSDFEDLRIGKNRNSLENADTSTIARNFGLRPFYVQTQIKGENFEDKMLANPDPYRLKNSGYGQLNFYQKFRFQAHKNLVISALSLFTTSTDIPRYDRLIETRNNALRFAEWNYGAQKWFLQNLKIEWRAEKKAFDRFAATVAYQSVEESRHNRNFGNPNRASRFEKVKIGSLNLNFDKFINQKNELYYGLELTYNYVASKAFSTHLLTQKREALDTRYPREGSHYTQAGTFVGYKRVLTKKWFANIGLRHTWIDLKADFGDDPFYDFPFEKINLTNSATTYSVGTTFHPLPSLQLDAALSSGFRAPNVDDVGKVFESEPSKVVVPNENLRPERTQTAEIGLKYHYQKNKKEIVVFQLNAFYTQLKSVILRRPFTFQGADSILYEGEKSAVQAYVNAASGRIYGISSDLKINFLHHFLLENQLTYTNGFEEKSRQTLQHIPPIFGRMGLQFRYKKLQLNSFFHWQGAMPFEKLPLEEQNKTFIYHPKGALAWQRIDLQARYLYRNMTIQAGIDNILDKFYQPYAWGIPAAGRSIWIGLRYAWAH
ncbi:TonB-dependent receptor [Hugenholtzia roseola]|uniref:TonB-dependent receptor n=1 Tax=Hugenholtzia roseola TaxID=1002 RepID=UPI0004254405|nr:TonB-dependent receptor [Hugenholtzia roseola]